MERAKQGNGLGNAWAGLGRVIYTVKKLSDEGALEQRSQRKDSRDEGPRLRTAGTLATEKVCL